MVDRAIATAVATFLLLTSARADLELNPKEETYEFEGINLRHLVFFDDPAQVTYTPPKGWAFSGTSAKLSLRPKDKPQAEGSVTRTPRLESTAFDEETLKKLTNEALASLPAGSSDVQLLSQEKDSVIIGQKETFLVTMSYTFYGQPYGRSVMFLNRGKEELRFQLVSRLADFKELQQAFQQSHLSWQNL